MRDILAEAEPWIDQDLGTLDPDRFRYRDPRVPEQALDELNLAIGRAVLHDGRVYVGTTRWAGTVGFRPAFVNWRTTTADADLMLATVRELGRRLA